MPWWGILIIVLVCLVIGVPMLVAALKVYIREIKEWKKQKKLLAAKDKPIEITKDEAMKQATKEFFVAFKPYFDFIEAGEIDKAKLFLQEFYNSCPHKTRICGKDIQCPECPYGGLIVMNMIDNVENNK